LTVIAHLIFYSHMPIGMLGIYQLLFFRLFFILFATFLVTDISGLR